MNVLLVIGIVAGVILATFIVGTVLALLLVGWIIGLEFIFVGMRRIYRHW